MNLTRYYHEFKLTPDYSLLSEDQKLFFDKFFTGKSIALLASAGTGKSHCINVLDKFLQGKGFCISKTSTTGVSAFSIGGQTINSWMGLGLAELDANELCNKIYKNKHCRKRIQNASVLFIDEISMCSGSLFDKIFYIIKNIRNNKPLQLIICGDPGQLPAIVKDKQYDYFFNSEAWKNSNIEIITLKSQKRQSDAAFISVLEDIRLGKKTDLSLIYAREDTKLPKLLDSHGIMLKNEPVRLFGFNNKVFEYNLKRLNELKGKSKKFYSEDSGREPYITNLDKNCLCEKEIELKVGAQVMLLKNIGIGNGLFNGAIGIVKDLSGKYPLVEFNNQIHTISPQEWSIQIQDIDKDGNTKYKTMAKRIGLPLKLSWAYSVHKSQSKTLESAEIDFKGFWEYGQAYTALSRVRNLDGLIVKNFSEDVIKCHPDVLRFYEELDKNQTIS